MPEPSGRRAFLFVSCAGAVWAPCLSVLCVWTVSWRFDSPWRLGQAEVTDTKPMGIPFHPRERSVEGALLSCCLYCVDMGFVCLFQFLLACASGRAKRFLPFCVFFCLLVRLAGLNCFCLPLSCVVVVVVVSRRRCPAGWFVSSFAPGGTQDVVFIKWYSHFVGFGNSSRPLDAIRCICVRVRSRRPCLWFYFRFPWFVACSQ